MANDKHVGREPAKPCPTPSKRGYATKKYTKQIIKKMPGPNRDDCRAYLCVCGSWHAGHKPGSARRRFEKQAARAARTGGADDAA
jgi:hypothetical protein